MTGIENTNIASGLPYFSDVILNHEQDGLGYVKTSEIQNLLFNLHYKDSIQYHLRVSLPNFYIHFEIVFDRPLIEKDTILIGFRLVRGRNLTNYVFPDTNIRIEYQKLFERYYYFYITYSGIYTDLEGYNLFAYISSDRTKISLFITIKNFNFSISNINFQLHNTNYINNNTIFLILVKPYMSTVGFIVQGAQDPINNINNYSPFSVNGSYYKNFVLNLNSLAKFSIVINTQYINQYLTNYNINSNRQPVFYLNVMNITLNDQIVYKLYYKIHESQNNRKLFIYMTTLIDKKLVFYPIHAYFLNSNNLIFSLDYNTYTDVNVPRRGVFYREKLRLNNTNLLNLENTTRNQMTTTYPGGAWSNITLGITPINANTNGQYTYQSVLNQYTDWSKNNHTGSYESSFQTNTIRKIEIKYNSIMGMRLIFTENNNNDYFNLDQFKTEAVSSNSNTYADIVHEQDNYWDDDNHLDTIL